MPLEMAPHFVLFNTFHLTMSTWQPYTLTEIGVTLLD